MAEEAPFDVTQVDLSRVVADLDGIRAINPHRFEMEMITAIVLIEPEKHRIVGYKDIRADEFWNRGHMPGYPIFPGVLMCEAAAQLCCFYNVTMKVNDPGVLMGLGGLEDTRFVRHVRPGERLVMVGHGLRVHRRMTRFHVIGYVNAEKAFETTVLGVPIGKWEDLHGA